VPVFTDAEGEYLSGQRLGRLATVTAAGHAHVVPTVFHLDLELGILKIGAHDLPDRGQKRGYRRNIATNPMVAFVVDDLASTDPWHPRGVSLRGLADIQAEGGELLGQGWGPLWVRIRPTWISSWGLVTGPYDPPYARKIG
jgi:pyridoxamine 5'-phosphate oxidase family protein